MEAPPRVLTIAGSDSGGGAGVQADLKTFAAHRVFGMSVITSVTAQNTVEVRAVHQVPPPVVRAQIEAVLDEVRALPDATELKLSYVPKEDHNPRGFYEKLGFEHTGEEDAGELVMRRRL